MTHVKALPPLPVREACEEAEGLTVEPLHEVLDVGVVIIKIVGKTVVGKNG